VGGAQRPAPVHQAPGHRPGAAPACGSCPHPTPWRALDEDGPLQHRVLEVGLHQDGSKPASPSKSLNANNYALYALASYGRQCSSPAASKAALAAWKAWDASSWAGGAVGYDDTAKGGGVWGAGRLLAVTNLSATSSAFALAAAATAATQSAQLPGRSKQHRHPASANPAGKSVADTSNSACKGSLDTNMHAAEALGEIVLATKVGGSRIS
jgi:hypothetical protein